MPTAKNKPALISIVVPAYNEAEVIGIFYHEVIQVLTKLPYHYEIIFINDGSTDNTFELIKELAANDVNVASLNFSRNFGKEIALTAGLDHARGDAIIVMDADLQDPPELIPDLIQKWEQGYNVVNARRSSRDGESWLKKTSAFVFYRLMSRFSEIEIPKDSGDFRLLSRSSALELAKLREHNRYMKGLFAWVGGKQTTIDFDRHSRKAGKTKWNYWQLWNLAIEGITSFSTLPLKLASYFGILIAGLSFVYGGYMVIRTVLFGNPVPGYPSLLVAVLFIGGIQLMSIGIIGEYLARIFNETKQRPLYIIQKKFDSEANSHRKTILDEIKK